MEKFICLIIFTACAILLFASVKMGTLKNLFISGCISTGIFLLLGFFKVLSLFKIGINFFTVSIVFFLGLPGMTSLLFFNVLSVL